MQLLRSIQEANPLESAFLMELFNSIQLTICSGGSWSALESRGVFIGGLWSALDAHGALWRRVERFRGGLWSALGGLWSAVEARGAPQRLVQRSAGGSGLWSAPLDAFGALWRRVERLDALVMEAR